MAIDKFTEKAQEALQGAAELARDRGQQAVRTEHPAVALVREEEGVARTLLDAPRLGPGLEPALVPWSNGFEGSGRRTAVSEPCAEQGPRPAKEEAERLKDEYISTSTCCSAGGPKH